MKIAVAKEHRDFFKKNGWIEFENILSDQQFIQLNQCIDQILSQRLSVPVDKLFAVAPENAFMQGRDLWRSDETLRKLICMPRLGEIVSEVIELKPLRLGYDQFIPSIAQNRILQNPAYAKFLQTSGDLENMNSIKGIVAGLLICLNDSFEELESVEGIDVYPCKAGHLSILNPQVLFNFANLSLHVQQRYYLIVYTQASAYYYQQPNDPHIHTLKKYGYVFNDKLNDKLNPIVFR